MEEALQGRYKLYKASTKRFVEWLTRRAAVQTPNKTTGFQAEKPCINDSARKASTRDLISFAQTVANTTCQVPCAIISLLEEIIEGRQACADWYVMKPKSTKLAKENENHIFFIEVLREVRHILSPLVLSSKSANGETKASSSKTRRTGTDLGSEISNLFTQLELEEPSDSLLGDAPAAPTNGGGAKLEVLFEEDDVDDTAFRLFCFLQDAKDVRDLLRQTWQEYCRGDISTLAACSITEAGIGLLRISNAAFVAEVKQFRDWREVLDYLGLVQVVIHPPRHPAFVYLHPKATGSVSGNGESNIDFADLICPAAAQHLRDTVAKLKELDRSEMGRDIRRHRFFLPSEVMSPDLFDFAGQFMLSALPELLMWNADLKSAGMYGQSDRNRTFHGNELEDGILDYYRTGVLPSWLPIAFQIHCDIYEVIGSNPARLPDNLFDTCAEMKRSVADYKKKYGVEFAQTKFDRELEDYELYTEQMRMVLHVDSSNSQRHNFDGTPMEIPAGTMKSLYGAPSTVATHMYLHKLHFYRGGIWAAGATLEILCLTHIYSAGRKLGIITSVWHDMELVISNQRSLHPLIAKYGSNADATTFLKHFLLALGLPATAFAKGKIPEIPSWDDVAFKGKRVVKTLELLHAIEKHNASKAKVGWDRELLEVMLTSLTDNPNDTQASSKGAKKRKGPAEHHTPLQLLSTFKKTFISDETMLNFDFFSFSNIARDIFLTIRKYADPFMKHIHISDKEYPHQFTAELFKSQTKRIPTQPRTALEESCEVLNMIIAKDGNANRFSLAAFSQSSGRIPKDLRPNFTPFDRSTVIIAPMMKHLSKEPSTFSHFTASSVTIFDPNGSAKKFNEAAQIQQEWQKMEYRGKEEAVSKILAEPLEDRYDGWFEVRKSVGQGFNLKKESEVQEGDGEG